MQASLFVLLLGFLGFLGWQSYRPRDPAPQAAFVPIDLNRATVAELERLDGVGAELAQRIVEHRDRTGPFEGLADLRRVPGIGPQTLEKLRPQISLSWTAATTPESERMPHTSLRPTSLVTRPEAILDPNTATFAELDKLPGIGPTLAQRIIDRRSKTRFATIDDLRGVPGIGAKTLDKLRPYLRVSGATASSLQ